MKVKDFFPSVHTTDESTSLRTGVTDVLTWVT
jgi:hypothetical protein